MHCYPPTASCVSNLSHNTSGYHLQHMVILHISVFTMVEGPQSKKTKILTRIGTIEKTKDSNQDSHNRKKTKILTRIATQILTRIATKILTRIATKILTRIATKILTRIATKILTRIATKILNEKKIPESLKTAGLHFFSKNVCARLFFLNFR